MRRAVSDATRAARDGDSEPRTGDALPTLPGTNRRLLPPAPWLRAFAVTARCGSVARAAEALQLTPGAVSKQIGELERWLGRPLFHRVRRRLVPTSEGEAYCAALLPAMRQIEAATLRVIERPHERAPLHVGVFPTLHDKWLASRLPAFRALHPDVELRVSAYSPLDNTPPSASLDALLRYGPPPERGVHSHYLVGREVVLIAPPQALRARPLETPHDVLHFELLHHQIWPDGWAQWCALHGVGGVNIDSGARLLLASSMIDAVSAGSCLALAPLVLVQDDIARGAVSAPFAPVMHEDGGYFLCCPARTTEPVGLRLLREWLLQAARETPRAVPAVSVECRAA